MAHKKNPPAITKVSDLAETAETVRPESDAVSASGRPLTDRELPAPLAMKLEAGCNVELLDDQVFADRVVIRRGETGRILYPSSQAASWVVHFRRVGPKFRVIPEPLLRVRIT